MASAADREGQLDRARAAFARRSWRDAYTLLAEADREAPLGAADLERLALTAQLLGESEESDTFRERAYHERVRGGDSGLAARSAFWLGLGLLERGMVAPGLGWIARAARLVEDGQLETAERGYLLLPVGIQAFEAGDLETAHSTFAQAAEIGRGSADPDLVALARHGQGRALLRSGDIARGLALLDEVMVAVTADELAPNVAGIVYCSVIEACREIFDLRRAREWTAALTRWCDVQPEIVPFRGPCLVWRVEIMRLRGAWPDALDEAQRALDRLSAPGVHPEAGEALYQQAELRRLRGEHAEAKESYGAASRAGRSPQPGLALLRLAQGETQAARSAIRRALEEARGSAARAALLPAFVEALLAAEEIPAARAAADELAQLAARLDAAYLHAVSVHQTGAVLLAEGHATEALTTLRRAWAAWRELEVPYEAARVRVLVGVACRALGDADGSTMELEAAAAAFEQLGAATDRAGVERLARRDASAHPDGLTTREVEVLVLIAAGKTNREIASDLFISEKTVARHVSNIFTKLGLSSRSAATAYAYEHHLVGRSG